MAKLIDLKTVTDKRGNLTVINNSETERVIPFDIKRIFYIYGVDNETRGWHRHHITIQAAICLQGECRILNNDGEKKETFILNRPDICLILEPQDWHQMDSFSHNAILMVLASEYFDKEDYIGEPYQE